MFFLTLKKIYISDYVIITYFWTLQYFERALSLFCEKENIYSFVMAGLLDQWWISDDPDWL